MRIVGDSRENTAVRVRCEPEQGTVLTVGWLVSEALRWLAVHGTGEPACVVGVIKICAGNGSGGTKLALDDDVFGVLSNGDTVRLDSISLPES